MKSYHFMMIRFFLCFVYGEWFIDKNSYLLLTIYSKQFAFAPNTFDIPDGLEEIF